MKQYVEIQAYEMLRHPVKRVRMMKVLMDSYSSSTTDAKLYKQQEGGILTIKELVNGLEDGIPFTFYVEHGQTEEIIALSLRFGFLCRKYRKEKIAELLKSI
jgi:hypothetical protein